MEEEAIEAVRSALRSLNRALAELPVLGVDAEVTVHENRVVSLPSAQQIVSVHLTRTKREIDVRL